jgi:hypothetical protein
LPPDLYRPADWPPVPRSQRHGSKCPCVRHEQRNLAAKGLVFPPQVGRGLKPAIQLKAVIAMTDSRLLVVALKRPRRRERLPRFHNSGAAQNRSAGTRQEDSCEFFSHESGCSNTVWAGPHHDGWQHVHNAISDVQPDDQRSDKGSTTCLLSTIFSQTVSRPGEIGRPVT